MNPAPQSAIGCRTPAMASPRLLLCFALFVAGAQLHAAKPITAPISVPITDPLPEPISAANSHLQAGNADKAIALLNPLLKSNPSNAEALNLLCRVEYSLQQFDAAAGHCEKAVNLSPQTALYHHWLGRAIGERADRANFMSAFSLARKTREEFEEAVKLDRKDADALSDLGEFYKEAPGAVGGGMDKAEAIAAKLTAIDPARAHQLRGEMAEKQKDLAAAETEFKAACTGSRAAIQWMELAGFYRHHERWAEMQDAVKSGEAAATRDKHEAVALFNGAATLARANRQPEDAIRLFRNYLASPYKSEEAPAFDALTRLAKLENQTGDTAGAQRDRAAALALAHDYKPAQDLKL